jgi:hypothetical protein
VAGHTQVEHFAQAADAFAIQDVELGRLERRRHLVLTTFTRVSLPMISSPFDRADAPDVSTGRRTSAHCRRWWFRAAEHHADLHADLVDEITMQLAFLMVAVSLRSAWLISAACRPGVSRPFRLPAARPWA